MTVDLGLSSDVDIIALTLWGEARNQGPEGRIAIANVIRNRVAAQQSHFGRTPREVCLKPKQFSCWIPEGGEDNHGVLMATVLHLSKGEPAGPLVRECQWIAKGLVDNAFVDNTHGATHYLVGDLFQNNPPSWARDQRPLARIGAHVFLRVA